MRVKLSAIFLALFSFFTIFTPLMYAAEDIKEVKLAVTDDTYITQSSPDAINGNKTSLSVKAYPGDNRLILLKFSTANVPKGSNIGSATLLLTSYSCTGESESPGLVLSLASDDWNEETARWNGRPRIGTDIKMIDPAPQIKSWNVTQTVNKWVQGTAENNGFILALQGAPYACSFYSKEKTSDSINLIVRFIPPDTTKPVISQIGVENITNTSAKIKWKTNEDADGYVDYFYPSGVGIPPIQNTGSNHLDIIHSVTLENLSAGKKYSFRVRSKDIARNEAISSYSTFTTKSAFVIPTLKFTIPTIKIGTLAPTSKDQVEEETAASGESEIAAVITPDSETKEAIEESQTENQEKVELSKEPEQPTTPESVGKKIDALIASYTSSPSGVIIALLVIIIFLVGVLVAILMKRKSPASQAVQSGHEENPEKEAPQDLPKKK